jgi:hypothetical protein
MENPGLKSSARQLCLAIAALLWVNVSAQAQYVFTTIDDPVAVSSNGTTYVTGISSNTVVGYYFGPLLHGFYHVLGTTNYTTLDEPLGFVNGSSSTEAFGISGDNIVGTYQNYQNGASGYYGFLYNIANATYVSMDNPSGDSRDTSHTWLTGIDGDNVVGYVSVVPSIYANYIGGFEAQFGSSGIVYDTSFYYPSIHYITVSAGYDVTNYTTYISGISGTNAVGYYLDDNYVYHGIIYNLVTGTYTALNSPTGGGCPLTGISGDNIVGYYADPNYGYDYSGFVYNLASGVFTATSLHDPLAPSENTFLEGISGNSVVGYYLDNDGVTHGFVASIPIPSVFLVTSGNKMVFNVTSGTPGSIAHLISSTSLTLPPAQWDIVSTNTFNTNGVFSFTNNIPLSALPTFFRLSEVP